MYTVSRTSAASPNCAFSLEIRKFSGDTQVEHQVVRFQERDDSPLDGDVLKSLAVGMGGEISAVGSGILREYGPLFLHRVRNRHVCTHAQGTQYSITVAHILTGTPIHRMFACIRCHLEFIHVDMHVTMYTYNAR